MDIVAITGAITGLKAITEIAKTINNFSTDYDFKLKTSDLLSEIMSVQGKMLDLQQQYQELIDENKSLKEKIQEMDNWNDEKKKYELFMSVRGGSFRRVKSEFKETEGRQALCPTCFEKKVKSYLQQANPSVGFIFKCSTCNSLINLNKDEI